MTLGEGGYKKKHGLCEYTVYGIIIGMRKSQLRRIDTSMQEKRIEHEEDVRMTRKKKKEALMFKSAHSAVNR